MELSARSVFPLLLAQPFEMLLTLDYPLWALKITALPLPAKETLEAQELAFPTYGLSDLVEHDVVSYPEVNSTNSSDIIKLFNALFNVSPRSFLFFTAG